MRDGRSMGNVVPNVYAKSNYDRLRIDKALGFRKSDKNKKKHKNKKSKNNVKTIGDPPGSKYQIRTFC